MEHLEIRIAERSRAYAGAAHGAIDCEIRTQRPALVQVLGGGLAQAELAMLEPETLRSLDETLDEVWSRDGWESRLAPFIEKLECAPDSQAVKAFRRLVRRGCQPDTLAEGFYRAVFRKVVHAHVEHAERHTAQLAALLTEASEKAAELRAYVVRRELGTRMPSDLPEMLCDAAKRILPERRAISESAVAMGRLLGALTHIERVTGRPRYEDAMPIFNALRDATGQTQIELDTLQTYAKRARRYRRKLRAELERVAADTDGKSIGS